MSSEKCVNCGNEVWLGVYFDGSFLCDACHGKAGEIIAQLREENRLLVRADKFQTILINKLRSELHDEHYLVKQAKHIITVYAANRGVTPAAKGWLDKVAAYE
jgi:putative NADPH-quinone reductase